MSEIYTAVNKRYLEGQVRYDLAKKDDRKYWFEYYLGNAMLDEELAKRARDDEKWRGFYEGRAEQRYKLAEMFLDGMKME